VSQTNASKTFIIGTKSVKLSQCHVTGRELQQILGVGVTAALSNLMQSLTVIVMNQFLLSYGNDKIAAMGIASKVSMIAQLVLVGFSFGGIPLFGYLYGAKKRDVMRKLIRFCLTFLVSIAVVLSLILCLNSGALMRLFVQDAGMIATGAQMLRWQVYTAAFGGVALLLTVLFQATGKIIPSFLLSISRQGVVFLLALVVCVHLFQYQGVLMAQAVADILSAALALGLLAASRDIIAKQ
jgi:multidrug efflux pump